MTFWHVVTKFFDSGKVKVNLAPIEADCKPENHMSENKTCDEYHDYFDTYEEAAPTTATPAPRMAWPSASVFNLRSKNPQPVRAGDK